MNPTDINAAANLVNANKVALDGDENLTHAKQQATQTIDHLDHLNQAQIQQAQEGIAQATDIDAVTQHVRDAQALDNAMNQLQNAIANQNDVKQQSQFVNADPDKQSAYTDAVAHAQSIIDHQHGPNASQPEVEQALTQVQQALQNLNGEQRLQDSKLHAQQAIDGLADLNDNETTRTAVKNDVTEAQQLDQYMDALQQSIADKQTTLDSSQYINADPNKKQDYDNAIQNAESIIAGITNPTINKDNVNQATESVNATKQALNGVEKLAEDKQHAGETMNQFNQLTPAQQQALNDAITDAQTRTFI